MSTEFEAWVASLHLDEPDAGGQRGVPVDGSEEFLRAMFADHGPVAAAELARLARDLRLALARHAAELVARDVRATTDLEPVIEVRLLDDEIVAVTFDGSYQTPSLFALREPESICEVADNLRDHVFDALWAVWPCCPDDGMGLDPRPLGGGAVWYCRYAEHVVARIGTLPAGQLSRGPGR